MTIKKIFNNNCVATMIDDEETIVTGSGIGFQKKVGDDVDIDRIEKKFKVVSSHQQDFENLVSKIPIAYFEVTRAIVEYANGILDRSLSDTINVSLTDHIYYAVLRSHENLVLPALFTEELSVFYPEEFEIAKTALKMVDEMFDVSLPFDEVSYIVMHLVNAREGMPSYHAQKTITFIHDVIEIIQADQNVNLDIQSTAYRRLSTHLKYLAQRVFGTGNSGSDDLEDINLFFTTKLMRYNNSVSKIAQYTQKKYDYELARDERMYLAIHIHQVTKKTKGL